MDGRKPLRSRLRTPFVAVQIQTGNRGPPPNASTHPSSMRQAGPVVNIHRGPERIGAGRRAIDPLTGGLKDAR